ncbi:hypothetical protein GQR58_018833 [Nymphon striatum]|nr:hypothetical protein GQR58_018833 [Nymphon striatum]
MYLYIFCSLYFEIEKKSLLKAEDIRPMCPACTNVWAELVEKISKHPPNTVWKERSTVLHVEESHTLCTIKNSLHYLKKSRVQGPGKVKHLHAKQKIPSKDTREMYSLIQRQWHQLVPEGSGTNHVVFSRTGQIRKRGNFYVILKNSIYNTGQKTGELIHEIGYPRKINKTLSQQLYKPQPYMLTTYQLKVSLYLKKLLSFSCEMLGYLKTEFCILLQNLFFQWILNKMVFIFLQRIKLCTYVSIHGTFINNMNYKNSGTAGTGLASARLFGLVVSSTVEGYHQYLGLSQWVSCQCYYRLSGNNH